MRTLEMEKRPQKTMKEGTLKEKIGALGITALKGPQNIPILTKRGEGGEMRTLDIEIKISEDPETAAPALLPDHAGLGNLTNESSPAVRPPDSRLAKKLLLSNFKPMEEDCRRKRDQKKGEKRGRGMEEGEIEEGKVAKKKKIKIGGKLIEGMRRLRNVGGLGIVIETHLDPPSEKK